MKFPNIIPGLTVTITEDCCSCSVTPEILQAKEGDQVWFLNLTKDTVIVMFPYDKLFEAVRIEIAADQVKPLTVQGVPRDTYPYAVYCKSCGGFADRASKPRIIVYDSRY